MHQIDGDGADLPQVRRRLRDLVGERRDLFDFFPGRLGGRVDLSTQPLRPGVGHTQHLVRGQELRSKLLAAGGRARELIGALVEIGERRLQLGRPR